MATEWFVPLRINKEEQIDRFRDYRVTWTPTIVVLDGEGREHARFTGFLSPREMCARMILDGAKAELYLESYELALKCLDNVLEHYQGTHAVPEAIFYRGVGRYLSSHDPKGLREALDRLRQDFPGDEWTLRAKPYEVIPR